MIMENSPVTFYVIHASSINALAPYQNIVKSHNLYLHLIRKAMDIRAGTVGGVGSHGGKGVQEEHLILE